MLNRYASIILAAAALLAAGPGSATRPGDSDPKKAALTFLLAAQDRDIPAMRTALLIDPSQKADVETCLSLLAAMGDLQAAANAQFGADAAQYFNQNQGLSERFKSIDESQVKIDGENADLALPGGTIQLKNMADHWKLDAASVFQLSTPPTPRQVQAMKDAAALTGVATPMAAEIRAGKFPSAKDAYNEFWARFIKQSSTTPTTMSATAPASMPAASRPALPATAR